MSYRLIAEGSYTYKRSGKYKTSYRVRYNQDGVHLDESLDDSGPFKADSAAIKVAKDRIGQAIYGSRSRKGPMVRSEVLCRELIELKKSKSEATYDQTEIFFRKHIIPWLNINCPIASELDSTFWLRYKNDIRLADPTVSLFNHWKFWVMLLKYAYEKGILRLRHKLDYNEEKEDFREEGRVIPDADLKKMIASAPPIWRDRIIIQRYTGMRPGEVRKLRKDRYNPDLRVISLKKEDTKTRRARAFVVFADNVVEILNRRLKSIEGPYFFPSGPDRSQPMDKSLKGWKAILMRAKVDLNYTPHDLRHTYLTEMFKTPVNPALICFQAGLSLEEATATYIHFGISDTEIVAKNALEMTRKILSSESVE